MIAVRKIKHEGGKERSWVSSLEWLVARLTRRAVRSETGENGTAPFQTGRLISLVSLGQFHGVSRLTLRTVWESSTFFSASFKTVCLVSLRVGASSLRGALNEEEKLAMLSSGQGRSRKRE